MSDQYPGRPPEFPRYVPPDGDGQLPPPGYPHGSWQPPAQGYPPGFGYLPTPPPRTSRTVIVAAVAGGALIVVLAVLAGFGLGRARNEPATASHPQTQPVSAPALTEGRDVDMDLVKVGDCFDDTGEDDSLHVLPCTMEHDAEVFALPVLPAGDYPGDNAVERAGRQACDGAYPSYVGVPVEKSELWPEPYFPDARTWRSGDRSVICAVFGPDEEPLEGSVRNSHR